jgi:hypothetical protein
MLRAARFFGVIFLTASLAAGFADVVYLLRHYTRLPFGDHWVWLVALYDQGALTAFFRQYNEHRIVVPSLLDYFDHRFFSNNALLMASSLLIQIGGMLALIVPVWRQPEVPKPVREIFAGFVVVLMLWFLQGENFFFPASLCLNCANLGIYATMLVFARLVTLRPDEAPAAKWWMAVLLVLAVLTSVSNGNGLLIWPALLIMAAAVRLPMRTVGLIVLLFVCVVAAYFSHYHTPLGQAGPMQALRRPDHILYYVVLLLGIPWFGVGTQDVSFTGNPTGFVVTGGAILVALGLLLHFAIAPAEHKRREQVFFCGALLASLGNAAMAALGRSHYAVSQALTSRYVPVPLMFWLSLAGLITLWLSRWEVKGGMGRAIWCAVLVVAEFATIPSHLALGRYFAEREYAQEAAAVSMTLGVPDPPRVAEDLAVMEKVEYVEQKFHASTGRSFFARPEAGWIGTPLTGHFQMASADACTGSLDLANFLPGAGERLVGWAWDARGRRDGARIWVTDDHQTIRGMGVTHIPRPDVAAVFRDRDMYSAGWVAYAQQTSAPLSAYVELSGGKSVCAVGVSKAAVR